MSERQNFERHVASRTRPRAAARTARRAAPGLVVNRIGKSFRRRPVVRDVSLNVRRGEIVGLLGPNGAGKTTIMKMLTGYLEPSAGRVLIDGVDLESDRERLQAGMGYLPENCPVYPEMTVLDYLDFAAELRGVPAAERDDAIRAAIEATELFDRITQPISALSRGLRQRVGVAQAILAEPKIIILDEPTNGLDPSQIQHMRALIRSLAQRATLLLSTHILQEVQAVCDRVVIVDRGRLALDAPLAELRRGGMLRVTATLAPDAARAAFATLGCGGARHLSTVEGAHSYEIPLDDRPLAEVAPRIARSVIDLGGELIALHPAQRDLESVFAEITSGPAAHQAGRIERAHPKEATHAQH